MTQKMLTSALFAGFAAGLIAALLHFSFVQKFILLGEEYETGAAVHFAGVASAEGADLAADNQAHAQGQDHDHGAVDGQGDDTGAKVTDGDAHSHNHGSDVSTFQRNALTVLFTVLVYCAYGLVLAAGFGLAQHFGRTIGPTEGVLWGMSGFAAFQLAPAMGLAPELPGTAAADLGLRQIWWWSTVVCTGAGIAALAYGRKAWAAALGAVLLAAPHVVGAPEIAGHFGVAPPEVAAAFSARVLATGLVAWAMLGWLSGYFWQSAPRN